MHSYHTTDDIHRNVHGSDLVCIDSPLLASSPSTESVERMLSFAVKLTCQRAWQQRCNNGVSVLAKSRGSTSADPVGGTILRSGNAFTLRRDHICETIIGYYLHCIILTRFNKIAIQGTPQMAVDKEAISLSRVCSYDSKCTCPYSMCNPP